MGDIDTETKGNWLTQARCVQHFSVQPSTAAGQEYQSTSCWVAQPPTRSPFVATTESTRVRMVAPSNKAMNPALSYLPPLHSSVTGVVARKQAITRVRTWRSTRLSLRTPARVQGLVCP